MIKGTLARKVMVAFIATLIAFSGFAPFAPSASAASNYTQIRFAGTDRFDTSALIASAIFEATPTAILARADVFPDALTGAFAAAANGSGPLLLTGNDSVPPRTMQALSDEAVDNVILLGGTAAISANVDRQLQDAGYQTARLEGPDRYGTAVAIADNGGPIIGSIDGERAALLSSGENFPDALAGAPLSFAGGIPSLLTPPNSLHPATADALDRHNISRVYILGGPAGVSAGVEAELNNRGFNTTRLSGPNRSATSVAIFEFGLDSGLYTDRRFGIARGDAFPDALSYGPLGGRIRGTVVPESDELGPAFDATNGLLLAASHCTLSAEVENFIRAHNDTWTQGETLGGPAAICHDMARQVRAAASNAAPEDVVLDPTSGPSGTSVLFSYRGERVATISGVSSTNCTIGFDGRSENRNISGPEGTQCAITTTVNFHDEDGSFTSETFSDTFGITGPPNVALDPTSGPSGTQVTATFTEDPEATITFVSSPNCTITNEGTQSQNRTFTVEGTPGTECGIDTTVEHDGGRMTHRSLFTITGVG